MTQTIRMLAVNARTTTGWAGPPDQSAAAGRRYYPAQAGGTIDPIDLDAVVLGSQGFFAVGNGSGPTASRPNNAGQNPGFLYVDTTLNLIVAWNGIGWVNPLTGASA